VRWSPLWMRATPRKTHDAIDTLLHWLPREGKNFEVSSFEKMRPVRFFFLRPFGGTRPSHREECRANINQVSRIDFGNPDSRLTDTFSDQVPSQIQSRSNDVGKNVLQVFARKGSNAQLANMNKFEQVPLHLNAF